MTPPSPPEFIVPFTKRNHLRHTRFAYKGHEVTIQRPFARAQAPLQAPLGRHCCSLGAPCARCLHALTNPLLEPSACGQPPARYSWRVLKAHLNEISDVLDAIIEGLLEAFAPILFWKGKAAAVSLSVCLLWQWLVSHPRFIPACLPMIGIIFLQRSYTRSERGARMNGGGSSSGRQAEGCNSAGIAARPGAIELLKALVLNKTPKPLTAGPITNEPPTAETD